ncbi:MAG: hypothetical protein K0R90_1280 [Oscillospiraceae bacterium]|jgi:tight adherence protein B|nr:hypothetical protein [Oscillospiraceae bacterium]
MTMLLVLAFAFIAIAIILTVGTNKHPIDINIIKEPSLKQISLKKLIRKKGNKLTRYFSNLQSMYETISQKNKLYTMLLFSLILAIVGIMAGVIIRNYFLCPVLAVALAFIPLLYIQFQYIAYKKLLVEELETALSVVSISYERTESIEAAIEENIPHINEPVKSIFSAAVFRIKHINPNIDSAILDMKDKVDHFLFKEWCDALRRCNHDRTLKHTLRPIVNKLTNVKIVTNELNNILFRAKRSFWQLFFLNILILFIGFYVLPSSFNVDMHSASTDFVLAVNVMVMIFCAIKAVLETRSVSFDN